MSGTDILPAMEKHPMRKIREVLRLRHERKLSHRQISASTGISHGSVADYLRRAADAKLTWEAARGLDDADVEARLFRETAGRNEPPRRVVVDLPHVHAELRRAGVTLQLLWVEYRDAAASALPSGKPYSYSQFCDLYAGYRQRVDLTMRQVHRAGEKAFIDFSGTKPRLWDPTTGEAIDVELFVAVLGASNLTYAEATRTQRLEDFCAATVRGFEYFGGVPQIAVPDQLRSAVSGPDRYDPDINPTYADLAQHYNVAIVPARPAKARDKAKVEVGVQIAQRWIVARLRNRTFFSLNDLNAAIAELLEDLNNRPFRKLEGCRRSLFEALDRPALQPLPARRWELARWKKATVNIDYHVEYESRYYSVPHALVGEPVEIRVTSGVVEVFHLSRRIASHARLWGPKGSASTLDEHRPKSHREYGAWPPSRIISWAAAVGPMASALVEQMLTRRREPETAYRSCLALIRDAKKYERDRFEAACRRAVDIDSPTRKTVLSILARGIENKPLVVDATQEELPIVRHENVRGGTYFDRNETEEEPS